MVRAYAALVFAVALTRIGELVISSRHAKRLRARGGTETPEPRYPLMVAMHTAFLVSCPMEVWLLRRPWIPQLGVPMLILLACAFALRYWAIATLGDRWSTRIICIPGEPLIQAGPYRRLRHPNYWAVVAEFVALPLVHTAWITALVFSCANAFILKSRIAIENRALARCSEGGDDRR